jgi:hypothetical protein
MSSVASCLPPTPAAAPALTVADIIRTCGDSFLQKYGTTLTATQRQALAAVAACRTPTLGRADNSSLCVKRLVNIDSKVRQQQGHRGGSARISAGLGIFLPL